jgi:peptidoglycan/LPS O-acetylase OafA/YrhL
LLVVVCHCGFSWCAGGFVGVDVFFVLSGYLITGLLVTECRTTSRIDLLKFYARRARRLVPASTLVLLSTTLFAAAVLSPQELEATGRAVRAASLYLSNVFFDRTASDYFASNVERNPVLHTWSLGLEEQFYLAWPLLVLLAYRGQYRARRIALLLVTVAVISTTLCVYATRATPNFAFYELPARAWEFAAGGLLALLPVSRKPVANAFAVGCGIAGLVLIIGTAVLAKGGAGFPGWIALFPVAGALATLFAGAQTPRRGVGTILGAAPLQFVGARSYSWYLWHWPFIVFAGAIFPGLAAGGKILAAGASLIAATVTFSLVERPIRQNSFLIARFGLSLRLAIGATLVAAGASSALISFARDLATDRNLRSIQAATADVGDISLGTCVSQGLKSDLKICEFGASAASRTIVLFGDSHAIQWFNPLRTAITAEAWRLVTILKSGCAAADINPHGLSAAVDVCKDWRTNAIEKIIAMHASVVVLADYTGATIRGFATEPPMSTDELRSGTRRTLEKFVRNKAMIVVLRDTPLPPFDVGSCVSRRALNQLHATASCDFDASVALNDAAYFAQRTAANGLANIYFLDFSDLICPGSTCPATQHGILVYRDDNHLTGSFAESLASTVRTRLFDLLRNANPTQSSQPSS